MESILEVNKNIYYDSEYEVFTRFHNCDISYFMKKVESNLKM